MSTRLALFLSHFRPLAPLVAALLCVVFVGTWPGAVVRPHVLGRAAPLPDDVGDRDGVLDVVVHASDGSDGEKPPLAHARVRAFAILDGRAHAPVEATSDRSGRATLAGLPHAEHWIVAEAEGRARASQSVVVASGAQRLDLELGVEHVLDVEVKTAEGAPIAGAELEVRGSDPFPVGARSEENGRVRVGRLGEGPFTVTARATGFEEVTRRRVSEGAPCVVTLGRQGALLVTVVSEAGEPVAGARVLVASPSLWPARVAETTNDGTVRIGGLDPGTYALRSVHNANVSTIDVGTSVGAGEEKAVELRLAPGVTIAARIVSAQDDEGIPGARVTLAEGGLSPFPLEGLTDKQGRVVLGPIARGFASLSARADGYVAKGAARVDDPPPAEVRLALVKGGALVGRIVDARGYAVDGATLRVVGTDFEGMPIDEDPARASFRDAHFAAALAGPAPLVLAGELGVVPGPVPFVPRGAEAGFAFGGAPLTSSGARGRAAPLDEPWVSAHDGTFRAAPVPPGRVRALVRHPQYVETMSDIVSLASEKDASVTIVLLRGGSLEGRVVDTRGRPIAGAHVTALATQGSLERATRAGSDGSFAFAALPQAMILLVSRDDDLAPIAARLEVAIPEGGKKTIEIALPEARPPLAVKVVSARDAPVDGAQISAVSLDPAEALRVTTFTDERGNAELVGARGLPLRIEVKAPGRATAVVVTTAETTTLRVELAPAESVTGEVWKNRRERIEAAEVTLQTDVGTHHARTNKDGVYTLTDVPPGPARLRVRAKGRAPMIRDVIIEERGGGHPAEIPRVELPEEGVVEGTVVDARGDPVAGARIGKDAVPTYLPAAGLPPGMAVSDAKGRFRLGELGEGSTTLEAYAPDVGRVRITGVRVLAGRTTDGVAIVLEHGEATATEPLTTGGVAVTLGETASGSEPAEIVIVAVTEGSAAERSGLSMNDVLLEVGGERVTSITDARARLSGPILDDVVVRVRRGERVVALRVAREAVRR